MYACRVLTSNHLTSVDSAYFAQHHIEQLIPTMSPVAFLASKFPGKSELEYRSHLGAFGITGLTGLVTTAIA